MGLLAFEIDNLALGVDNLAFAIDNLAFGFKNISFEIDNLALGFNNLAFASFFAYLDHFGFNKFQSFNLQFFN